MAYIKRIFDNSVKVIFRRENNQKDQSVEISIIIPVKNEADNIKGLSAEINQVMEKQSQFWECIWVDDGSTDDSLSILQEMCEKDTHHHRYLSFEHNAGLSAAFWAGFRASRGMLLATFDGDSQNDPSDIPYLMKVLYSQGVDMVNGYCCKREDNLMRRLAAKISNSFNNWITGETIHDIECSTRVFKKECILDIPLFTGMYRFFPSLVSMQGYRLIEVPIAHHLSSKVETKYSVNNSLLGGIIDILGILWLKKRSLHYKIIQKS